MNLLTGIADGKFSTLKVRNPSTGQYEDIVPGQYASQGDLLQVYVGGVLYSSVRALNFTDPQFYLDNASGIMNIGQQLHQSFLRLGTSSLYSELTRDAAGQLLWDGNPVTALAHYSEASGVTTTLAQSFDTATPISTHIAWDVFGS